MFIKKFPCNTDYCQLIVTATCKIYVHRNEAGEKVLCSKEFSLMLFARLFDTGSFAVYPPWPGVCYVDQAGLDKGTSKSLMKQSFPSMETSSPCGLGPPCFRPFVYVRVRVHVYVYRCMWRLADNLGLIA